MSVTDDENSSIKNVHEGVANSGVESWELHSMATLLDPRFKVKRS